MNNLYHYTIADRLVKILIDGYLKLTPSIETATKNEPRLVWMTTSEEWDKTAFYGYPLEVLKSAGMIRITIDSSQLDLINMNEIYFKSCCKDLLIALKETAAKVGVNVTNWRITDKEVPVSAFLNIELWRNEQWEKIPINLI